MALSKGSKLYLLAFAYARRHATLRLPGMVAGSSDTGSFNIAAHKTRDGLRSVCVGSVDSKSAATRCSGKLFLLQHPATHFFILL
jgi:hypothetical protein